MQLFMAYAETRSTVIDVELVVNYWLCLNAKDGSPNLGLVNYDFDGTSWLHYA